jgi:hypothetical protein
MQAPEVTATLIQTPKVKETLMQTAKRLEYEGGKRLPRLETRNLRVLILWFIDNYPDIFESTSIEEFFANRKTKEPWIADFDDLCPSQSAHIKGLFEIN